MSRRELINFTPHDIGESEAFDYGQLPASIRSEVEQETRTIHELLARTATHVVQIGLRLQLVRDQIGRDAFQSWLRAEFRWSRSVASKYMCAARVFRDHPCLGNLQPSALYVLARKKVSSAAREEALRLAERGQFVSKARAEAIVAGYTQDSPPRNQLARLRRYIHSAAQGLSAAEKSGLARELTRLAHDLTQNDVSGSRRRRASQ